MAARLYVELKRFWIIERLYDVIDVKKQHSGAMCPVTTNKPGHGLLPSIEPLQHVHTKWLYNFRRDRRGAKFLKRGHAIGRQAKRPGYARNQCDTINFISWPHRRIGKKFKRLTIEGIVPGIWRDTLNFHCNDTRLAWEADTFNRRRKNKKIWLGHSSKTTSLSQSRNASSASSFSRPN